MSADQNQPVTLEPIVPENIEFRLCLALVLSDLLRHDRVTSLKRGDSRVLDTVEAFVRSNLRNLLLEVMGEKREMSFSDEEMSILKTMASKIKQAGGLNNA